MSLRNNQIQVLTQACQNSAPNSYSSVALNVQADECACWRWATNGLSLPIVHDPAEAFTYISLPGMAINPASGWSNPYYTNDLLGLQQRHTAYSTGGYAPINGMTYDAWFDSVVSGVAQEMCLRCGLNPAAGPHPQNNGVRYYVQLKFDRTDSHGAPYPPNYTHWWLRIDLGGGQFVCIEMFPGSNTLTFRWNNAHATGNVTTVEITNLHPAHLTVLNALIP